MTKESADFVGSFRREDVLKLTCLLLYFRFAIHGQRVGEKALGQTMAPNDIGGPLMSARRQLDDCGPVAGRNAGWF